MTSRLSTLLTSSNRDEVGYYFIPHYPDVLGYTFPICARLLDSRPRPRRLADIPEPEQSALVTTLAFELANVAKLILVSNLAPSAAARTKLELYQKYGGIDYVDQERKLRAARDQQIKIEQRLIEIDRVLQWYYDFHLRESAVGFRVGRGPMTRRVRWRLCDMDPTSPIEEYSQMKQLHGKLAKAKLHAHSLQRVVDRMRAEISSNRDFQDEWESWNWRLKLDWSQMTNFQANTAVHYLRSLDYDWWVSFAKDLCRHISRQAEQTLPVALRDPAFLASVGECVAGRDWYETASEVIAKEENSWQIPKSTAPGTIKKARHSLRQADVFGMQWFKAKGRTANFYVRWLARLNAANVKRDWGGNLPLDMNWLEVCRREFVVGPVNEDEDMRLNELGFCLARGGESSYAFQYFGLQRDRWNAHVRNWWPLIERRLTRLAV